MAASPDVMALVRTERLALLELLDTLGPDEWATPSLCGAWTVQQVAAHLAWAPVLPVREAVHGLWRARLRVNRMNADLAVGWSTRGPDAILEQLRENAARGARPPGVPKVAAISDAVVHALDIRRPLRRPRRIPQDAFVTAATFHAGLRWPLSASVGGNVRSRIDGLRLVADDLDWAHGHGPEVRGPGEALLLVLAGRPVGPGELTGPGAATLLDRLRRR